MQKKSDKTNHYGYRQELWVTKDDRAQGIGRKLIKNVYQMGEEQG